MWGVGWGLAFALVYIAFVLLLYAVRGTVPFERHQVTLPGVIATYFAGALTAGTIVGMMRPLTATRLGAIVTGAIAAVPVYLGFGIAVDGWFTAWSADEWSTVWGLAPLMGGTLGYLQWKQSRAERDHPPV